MCIRDSLTAGPTHGGPMMSMRHCAVAAGLGQFGWHSIVLTPEFGPRNRFGAVLTTLKLKPDPMMGGKRLCDFEKCHICEKVCPTGAIPPYKAGQERIVDFGEGQVEKSVSYTHLDVYKRQLIRFVINVVKNSIRKQKRR